MIRRALWVSITGALTVVLLASGQQFRPEKMGGGGAWLSWTPAERNTYIYGFLDGYFKGRNGACDAADTLFEVGKPHRLGSGQGSEDQPSSRWVTIPNSG